MQNCPSRRTGGPFKNGDNLSYFNCNPAQPPLLARSDYAANIGFALDSKGNADTNQDTANQNGPGPPDMKTGDDPKFWNTAPYNRKWTGVIFQRSEIRITDITNGTSNTYLLGEKYINPTDYFTGLDGADNENMFIGFDNDICRTTAIPPLQDKRGYQDYIRFGSTHVGGFNMLYCDGRVELVSYDVDPKVHLRAGDRR
jgi:prepilin-type processing-associated H-X9-DG protein